MSKKPAAQKEESQFYFDEEAADRPVRFIERFCTLTGDNPGAPFNMLDYQKQMVKKAFGWKWKKDGFRKHLYNYLEIPKKNGKSELLSALGIYLLMADGEKGAEIYACAGDKEQARIIFDAARQMVEQSEWLSERLEVWKNSIVYPKGKSFFKVLSADAATKHGPNIHALLFDELHVQPNSMLWDTLVKGIAARNQPQVWAITTAGIKNTFAHEKHLYAKKLQDGVIQNPYWNVKIYSADEKDDPLSEETWKKANPAYGITVKKRFFESEKLLIEQSPSELSAFQRLHLNIWTGTEKSWEILQYWNKCNKGPVTIERNENKQCFAGVDLSSKRDFTAAAFLFPTNTKEFTFGDDEQLELFVIQWLPEDAYSKKIQGQEVNFHQWKADGFLKTTPGNVLDYGFVKNEIVDISTKVQLLNVAFDPWNSADIQPKLNMEGIETETYNQTIKYLSPPTKELERLVVGGLINHGDNPILHWNIGNAVIIEDSSRNIRPKKRKKEAKIDGLAATLNALGLYLVAKHEASQDVGPILSFI